MAHNVRNISDSGENALFVEAQLVNLFNKNNTRIFVYLPRRHVCEGLVYLSDLVQGILHVKY